MGEEKRREELFDLLLRTVDFSLVKYPDGWGLLDKQGANLGDIEADRFSTADAIVDRLEIYIEDYFVSDIQADLGLEEFSDWSELVNVANEKMAPDDLERYHYDLALLDMACNHSHEVELEKCCFITEECEAETAIQRFAHYV